MIIAVKTKFVWSICLFITSIFINISCVEQSVINNLNISDLLRINRKVRMHCDRPQTLAWQEPLSLRWFCVTGVQRRNWKPAYKQDIVSFDGSYLKWIWLYLSRHLFYTWVNHNYRPPFVWFDVIIVLFLQQTYAFRKIKFVEKRR